MRDTQTPTGWQLLGEFPLFVLRVFTQPRSLVRNLAWEDAPTLRLLALYTLAWCAILVLVFHDNRELSDAARPRLSTFKGEIMRAHDSSWDWLEPLYQPFNVKHAEAKRLWDTLLTTGFLSYAFLAALLALAVVARLRMAWRRLSFEYALGTGLLGFLPLVTCVALSLVPLTLFLICRHCGVRVTLCILLNLAGWAYCGYYTLGDWGERPRGLALLLKSLGWGLLQTLLGSLVFMILIAIVLPM